MIFELFKKKKTTEVPKKEPYIMSEVDKKWILDIVDKMLNKNGRVISTEESIFNIYSTIQTDQYKIIITPQTLSVETFNGFHRFCSVDLDHITFGELMDKMKKIKSKELEEQKEKELLKFEEFLDNNEIIE